MFAEHSPSPPWTGQVGTMVGKAFEHLSLRTHRKAEAEEHPWLQRMTEISLFCEVALGHGTHQGLPTKKTQHTCEVSFLIVEVKLLKAAWHQPAKEPYSVSVPAGVHPTA